jgi:hypothetical protein
MSGVAEFVPGPSKLISQQDVENIVTAAILVGESTAEFAEHYCDLEGLYCDDRMEVTSTCFVAWLYKRQAMGIYP